MPANLISNFFVPLLLTIVIEVFIAFLFGYWDKKFIAVIVLMNVITNPVLNYLIALNNLFNFVSYSWIMLSFMECLVILVEWRILVYAFNNENKKWLLLSITMNLASFILGIILLKI